MRNRFSTVGFRPRGRASVLTTAMAATLVLAACGGSPDAGDSSADTLALMDREMDLAMSGDSAQAELRDQPQARDPEPTREAQRPAPQPAPAPAPAPRRRPAETPREAPPPVEAEPAAEEPAPDPGPSYEERTVSSGTTFGVTLNQELSTRTNQLGDLFTATMVNPLTDGRYVLVPAGATVRGEITAVQRSGGQGQQAVLTVKILEVSFDGETYPMHASVVKANPVTKGTQSTGEKAAKIGGAAAAGAILGRIIGGNAVGTIIGTAVGGAAGSAIVLGTEDVDAILPKGSEMTLRLDAPLEVRIEVS